MTSTSSTSPGRLPVTVIVGATSKWRPDGRNTQFIHGRSVGEDLPTGVRWGLGGALAHRFAAEGQHVVLTTRKRANAEDLAAAVREAGGSVSISELDVGSPESVTSTFKAVREEYGAPEVLVYNAGYMAGRELPEEQELLEHFPTDLFE